MELLLSAKSYRCRMASNAAELSRPLNGREYGCATHNDCGDAVCTNSVRVKGTLAEARVLDKLAEEILSSEAVALLEKQIREHVRKAARSLGEAPRPQAVQVTKKHAEIEQLRALMKAGTLSQAVPQAAGRFRS